MGSIRPDNPDSSHAAPRLGHETFASKVTWAARGGAVGSVDSWHDYQTEYIQTSRHYVSCKFDNNSEGTNWFGSIAFTQFLSINRNCVVHITNKPLNECPCSTVHPGE